MKVKYLPTSNNELQTRSSPTKSGRRDYTRFSSLLDVYEASSPDDIYRTNHRLNRAISTL